MKKQFFKAVFFLLALIIALTTAGCNNGNEKGSDHVNKENKYIKSPEEPINEKGITWPKGQAIPTMAPLAETIDAVYFSAFNDDQFTTLSALQGLVNREQPRILIVKGDDIARWSDNPDQYKYNEFKGRDAWNIFEKYKDYFKGYVIYDTRNFGVNYAGETVYNGSRNLATTVAGLQDLLPVSESTYKKLLEMGLDKPVVEDYRNKFKNNIEVFTELYDKYWKDCTKRILFSMSPGEHTGYIRDMAVAIKAAVVWLDPRILEEVELMNKFLDDMTPGESIIMGWWHNETAGIRTGTKKGIPTVPSDYFENSTIHAAMDRKVNPPAIHKKPKLENKVYIALTFTDGDNLQYVQHVMRERWNDSRRRSFPISWTFSPVLVDAAPDIMDYYYRTATENDCLVSGPSGLGYASVENFPPELVEPYARWTEQYLAKSGITVVTQWRSMDQVQDGYNNYTRLVRSLYGFTTNDSQNKEAMYEFFNNVPRITQDPWYEENPNIIYSTLKSKIDQNLSKLDSQPLFFAAQANVWKITPRQLETVVKKLQSDYGSDKVEFVRLDHLFMLICEYENKPYNLCLSADVKITGSDNSNSLELVADGTPREGSVWSAANEGEKWISFDLGAEYSISRYVISFAGAAGMDKSLNVKDYRLLASTDGSQWVEADIVKGNEDHVRDIDLGNVKARYIKIIIDNPGADNIGRIADVEIFGVK